MEPAKDAEKRLIELIIEKGSLKQEVYFATMEVFRAMKKACGQFISSHKLDIIKARYPLAFDYVDQGDFSFQIKFGSDVLVFFMHSNVFEIPRDHIVMKSSYIRENKNRSYCGIIHIYNFLGDSLKYNRESDLGYCIARIFVNVEKHYFTEGKREIGLLFNNFHSSVIDSEAIQQILMSAIEYTLNFDLLTPPYDSIKEVSVSDIHNTIGTLSLKTAKRLGFRFLADDQSVI
jgi:hypothetical protein